MLDGRHRRGCVVKAMAGKNNGNVEEKVCAEKDLRGQLACGEVQALSIAPTAGRAKRETSGFGPTAR